MTLSFRMRAILLTLATVFIAETAVMVFLPFLHLPPGSVVEGLVDATVLTAVILPFLLRAEAKRAHAEVRAAHLAAIVEHAEDAVVGITLDFVIASWNAGAERLTGYRSDEALGRPATVFLPPDRQHEVAELIARLNRGESVAQFETVAVKKDGTRYDVVASLAPIKDSAGRLTGVSVIAHDVSDRKRALAKL